MEYGLSMTNGIWSHYAFDMPLLFSGAATMELEAGKGHGAPAITASISQVSRGQFVRFRHPWAVTYCKEGKTIVSVQKEEDEHFMKI